MMIGRMPYKSQPMNMVHKSKHGGQIWLGDYFAATNLPLLKQKEVKSVLTSAAMLGVAYPKDAGINHKTINAFDVPSYKMTPHFDEAFKFIDDALRRGNLLVHCAAGISRSTTFVLVYLMQGEHMTFKHALDYVRSKRNIVCPNEGFQKQLKKFELTIKKNIMEKDKNKDSVKGQENGTQSKVEEEKQAVLDFVKSQKKEEPKSELRMTSTVGGSQVSRNFMSTNPRDFKGVARGNSLNYGKKTVYNVLNDNGNKLGTKQANGFKDEARQTNKMTKQFLTFKLQAPRIVTIKK